MSTSMIHWVRKGEELTTGPEMTGLGPPRLCLARSTYMVPPALAEVGQLVLQAILQELEHHTDDHAHPPVPDHEGL